MEAYSKDRVAIHCFCKGKRFEASVSSKCLCLHLEGMKAGLFSGLPLPKSLFLSFALLSLKVDFKEAIFTSLV